MRSKKVINWFFGLIFILSVTNQSWAEFRADSWDTPEPEIQLEMDRTLLPMGKGAVFVPCMTNPELEPFFQIFKEDEQIASGPTGSSLLVRPGEYVVKVGSGAMDQKVTTRVMINEGRATIVKPTWSGLSIRVVDETDTAFRGSYELINMKTRESIGIGYGSREELGEKVKTWLLQPGIYKIVRVGENYRARINFATVRLLPSELTHYVLVQDEDDGEFRGAGISEGQLGDTTVMGNWKMQLLVGGDFRMVSVRKEEELSGYDETYNFNLFLDSKLFYLKDQHLYYTRLMIDENLDKQSGQIMRRNIDRLDLDSIYTYYLFKRVGPYISFGLDTNILNHYHEFTESKTTMAKPTTIVVKREDDSIIYERPGVTRFKKISSLSPLDFKEGLGINFVIFKGVFADLNSRAGISLRQMIGQEHYEFIGEDKAGKMVFKRIGKFFEEGVEFNLNGDIYLGRWVVLTNEFDLFQPFETGNLTFEWRCNASLNLSRFASLNYNVNIWRDLKLKDITEIKHNVLLRFSFDVLSFFF